MPARKRIAVIAAIVSTLGPLSVQADWGWNKLKKDADLDRARNTAWPQPFVEMDVMEVTNAFDRMKHNGWRFHHTVGHTMFRDHDGALTATGHNSVRNIVENAPANRRTLYVLNGRSETETQARLASTRRSVDRLGPVGQSIQIMVTHHAPPTASGEWANKVSRDWIKSIPIPQLPDSSGNGTAGVTTSSGDDNTN
ncbi:MAG: hypothetical protein AAF664_21895 [Planctomycetota bacterium]